MITQLRRKLKSKTARSIILWVILLALSAGLIVSLLTGLFKWDRGSGNFVMVNSKELSVTNFRMKVKENEQRLQMFRRYFGVEADNFLKKMGMAVNPRVAALQMVIQNELLDQSANKIPICLSSEFVTQKITDKSFLQREFALVNWEEIIDPQGGVDENALRFYLRMSGINVTDFEEMIIDSMKRDLLAKLVNGATYVPEFEIKQKYRLDNLARKFSLLKFDFSSFLEDAKKAGVNKTDLKKFYDEQNNTKKRYWVPEKRAGIVYTFEPKSYGVVADEDEIKNYYDDNKLKNFVEAPAKIQVRRILFESKDNVDRSKVLEKVRKLREQLVRDPKIFAEKAKEFSEDKDTAKDGGLLPFFSRGERDRELEKAAFLLKQDGQISDVITTEDGIEIVQRVKREDTKFKPLNSVKDEIKKNIVSKKFKILFAKDMNKALSRDAYDDSSLKDLAKKATKKETIVLQIKGADKASQALFRVRQNIPTYYTDDDKGFVVQLIKRVERNLPKLDTIEDTVKHDYFEKKASDNLDIFLKKVRKEAQKKGISELQKTYEAKYKATIDNTGLFKQSDAEKVAGLRSKGYPVEQILKLDKIGLVDTFRGGPEEITDGYIVKLDEIEKFNEKEYDKKKVDIAKELKKARNMVELEEFIAFLRRKATIKVNR